MLNALQTVFGAVATKDIVPILCHILIYKGRMQAGDGCVTIDCKFDNDIPPCAVPGQKLLQAVKACGDTPNLGITEAGKLSIKKNKFRAFLSILPMEDFPIEKPDENRFPVPPDFLTVIKTLRPFVSKDASRPWSMGVLLDNGFAYATNNIILVRQSIPWIHHPVVIPLRALDDLLAVQENPVALSSNENSVTFYYRNESWLKTQVVLAPWPDIGALLDAATIPEEPVPQSLLEDVIKVRQFCTNTKFPQVTLGENVESDDGGDKAIVEGYALTKSVWHADHLEMVLRNATKIDFTNYPKPCSFANDSGLFGVFVGVRQQ